MIRNRTPKSLTEVVSTAGAAEAYERTSFNGGYRPFAATPLLERPLSMVLRKDAERIVGGRETLLIVEVAGSESALPDYAQDLLVRISTESISLLVTGSSPSHISLHLTYGHNSLRLVVGGDAKAKTRLGSPSSPPTVLRDLANETSEVGGRLDFFGKTRLEHIEAIIPLP